jgi:hypothetical protein
VEAEGCTRSDIAVKECTRGEDLYSLISEVKKLSMEMDLYVRIQLIQLCQEYKEGQMEF